MLWGHDHLWWLDRMVRLSPAARRADDARLVRPATSNSGVGSQRLDAQAEQAQRAGLGSFQRLLLADPRSSDAALAFRNGQREGLAERELRGAMMELFTPAPWPRLHRTRRARNRPARWDWLPERLGRRQGPRQFPLRPEASRPSAQRSSGGVESSTGRTHAGLSVHPPQAPLVLRHEALGPSPLRSRRLREGDWSSSTSGTTSPSAPSSRRSFAIRGCTGGRETEALVVYLAGMLRDQARIEHRGRTWLAGQAGQQLFYPPNALAGTTTGGSTPPRFSRAGTCGPRAGAWPSSRPRGRARRPRTSSWSEPPSSGERRHRRVDDAARYRRSRPAPSPTPTSAGRKRSTRHRSKRPAPPDSDLLGPADVVMNSRESTGHFRSAHRMRSARTS